jgi:DNA-binding Lrp family transcriptional regulator
MSSDFLEVFLASEGRARLVKYFILNPFAKTSVQTLKEKLRIDERTIKRELEVLRKIGLVKKRKALSKYIYFLDKTNAFYPEVKKIVAKCTIFPQLKSLEKIPKTGHVKMVLMTGLLANNLKTRADLLIVGDAIARGRLNEVIKEIEAEIGREVRYTTFSFEEYEYRLNMYDKFIREFFEGPHKIIHNRMGEKGIPNLQRKEATAVK